MTPTNAPRFDSVFTTSSPATRPDWCDSVGSWRVSHPEALESVIVASGREFGDCYVTNETNAANGRRRLWVGLRGNRETSHHAERVASMLDLLRAAGMSVRGVKDGGRLVALRVTDKVDRYPLAA